MDFRSVSWEEFLYPASRVPDSGSLFKWAPPPPRDDVVDDSGVPAPDRGMQPAAGITVITLTCTDCGDEICPPRAARGAVICTSCRMETSSEDTVKTEAATAGAGPAPEAGAAAGTEHPLAPVARAARKKANAEERQMRRLRAKAAKTAPTEHAAEVSAAGTEGETSKRGRARKGVAADDGTPAPKRVRSVPVAIPPGTAGHAAGTGRAKASAKGRCRCKACEAIGSTGLAGQTEPETNA